MPGPQSAVFFLLLAVVFGVAIWRAVASRRIAFRVLAGVLAFLPAMLFGVAATGARLAMRPPAARGWPGSSATGLTCR